MPRLKLVDFRWTQVRHQASSHQECLSDAYDIRSAPGHQDLQDNETAKEPGHEGEPRHFTSGGWCAGSRRLLVTRTLRQVKAPRGYAAWRVGPWHSLPRPDRRRSCQASGCSWLPSPFHMCPRRHSKTLQSVSAFLFPTSLGFLNMALVHPRGSMITDSCTACSGRAASTPGHHPFHEAEATSGRQAVQATGRSMARWAECRASWVACGGLEVAIRPWSPRIHSERLTKTRRNCSAAGAGQPSGPRCKCHLGPGLIRTATHLPSVMPMMSR